MESNPMQKLNDLSRSLTPLKPEGTLIAVIEMSLSSWLVAGIVPGVERQPSKKLEVDENALLKLLIRWREEAKKAGQGIERIAVAFEAGRDGFWLARWLRARDIEAHVIHASSVAVSREHRRAKTDRLDTELLKRSFLGWLRGERDHCKMVAIPTIKDEDARRPNRERESLVGEQSRIVNRMKAALIRLGIRGFNPKLKKASERLDGLRTPEGWTGSDRCTVKLEADDECDAREYSVLTVAGPPDHRHPRNRDAVAMAVTSTKRFSPFPLDAVNLLLADVRGALGPFLNVFLVTQ
jgi:transposase